MTSAAAEIIMILIAVVSASLAIKRRPEERDAQSRMQKSGAAGERRVARALARAQIPAVHDVTIRDRRGSHQIDHIAAAGDRLFVLETKTWRGDLQGRPAHSHWTLNKPGHPPAKVYNPILQNETHLDAVKSVTRAPVESIVVMAGDARMPGGLPEPVLPLAAAILRLTEAGPPRSRAMAALARISEIKQAARQDSIAGRHIRRMRRMQPTQSRKLWTLAAMASAAFVWMLVTHRGARSF